MKRIFKEPKVFIVELDDVDLIATSGVEEGDGPAPNKMETKSRTSIWDD